MPATAPSPEDQARVFLALWPGPGLREALLAHQRAWRWTDKCAWVPPQNLHLTLHFIGFVPRAQLAKISGRLAVPFAPFEMEFGRPALWRPGVAVLEPLATPAALLQLRETLDLALRQLGLQTEERPFRPHVTLARHADEATAPTDAPQLHWPVKDYVLAESAAGRYQVLQRYA